MHAGESSESGESSEWTSGWTSEWTSEHDTEARRRLFELAALLTGEGRQLEANQLADVAVAWPSHLGERRTRDVLRLVMTEAEVAYQLEFIRLFAEGTALW